MNITQAILPVAGMGTRFLPWTKVVPKELLPIGNQPIIALLVDECLAAGITDICFVISRGKEAIPEYFWSDPALEHELDRRGKVHFLEDLKRYDSVNFHVVYQQDQLGDGHALLQARGWAESDTIAVLFGDDLIANDVSGLQQLIDVYETLEQSSALLTLENIPQEQTYRYGIIESESTGESDRLHKVSGLVEKPNPEDAPSTLGIVGRYLIPQSTLSVLTTMQANHAKELRLIDALTTQLGTTPIFGFECEGARIDTGTPEGYREAVKILG